MYSLKSILAVACLAAASYGCMPEGGYCLYGSCCASDNTVCNPDTMRCEKPAELVSQENDTCLGPNVYCYGDNSKPCCPGLVCG